MSTMERRNFQQELDQLARDVEKVQASVIRIALDLAEDGQEPYILSRAVTGAYQLDQARTTLARVNPGTGSGGTTGQTDPVRSEGGGLKA